MISAHIDAANRKIDFNEMTGDLRNVPKHSLADICEEKGLFPLFDCAHRGFASDSADSDIKSFPYFVSRGFETLSCQSFAKNFGLYIVLVIWLSLQMIQVAVEP